MAVSDTASHAQVPPPSSEIAYAFASEGITSIECLPLEMKTAPSLSASMDLAMCMATPVIPDEGPGAEVRQRVAAIGAQAEAQLRLRYAEEIASRAVVRLRRMSSGRKRSLDDLDLHEALQEVDDAAAAAAAAAAAEDGGANTSKRQPLGNGGNDGGDGSTKKAQEDDDEEDKQKKMRNGSGGRDGNNNNVMPFRVRPKAVGGNFVTTAAAGAVNPFRKDA